MITKEIQKAIDASVLCWLATVSEDGSPSVSPKEAFLHDGKGHIIIANIASPGSVANIRFNNRVCVSFIDVFVQKGFKIRGKAGILEAGDDRFDEQKNKLVEFIGGDHPIISIIEVSPLSVEPIIAPSYRLCPGRTEADQIAQALDTYKVREHLRRQDESAQAIP